MLSENVKPICIVQRIVWGQWLPAPSMRSGPLTVSNQQAIQMLPQERATQHHELRMTGLSQYDYEMFCIFCGEVGTQKEWMQLIRGLIDAGE